jgi:hypothetical protein
MIHNVRRPQWAILAPFMVISTVLVVLSINVWAVGVQQIRFGIATAGGGTSTGGSLRLVGVAGQPAVGKSSGGTFSLSSGQAQITNALVSAVPGSESEIPQANALNSPYPNPFNPMTNVRFELATAGRVRVRIFDASGRKVRDLVQGEWPAGRHLVRWDGKTDQGATAASGVYFLRFEAAGVADTKKMTLLK